MSQKPEIQIDKDAVRFIYPEGQTNLFWTELFMPPKPGLPERCYDRAEKII